MAYNGRITSWGLLGLTFVIGLGSVLHILTWQATIPVLVPREQLSRAIALGSISFNLARAVGPAIGGVLIALMGAWIAFAVNAVSFAGVLLVLVCWQREETESANGVSFRDSMKEGLSFAMTEPPDAQFLGRRLVVHVAGDVTVGATSAGGAATIELASRRIRSVGCNAWGGSRGRREMVAHVASAFSVVTTQLQLP